MTQLTSWSYCVSLSMFSLAPALGSLVGILLTEAASSCAVRARGDLPVQILQGGATHIIWTLLTLTLHPGVATGTILYVVFHEVLPKGRAVGGTGKQHIAAMMLGFAMFLPSLYFREQQHTYICIWLIFYIISRHWSRGG